MGAAQRRRQRQLRSFLRHEELSVKMAVARALHHSAQRVEAPSEGVEGVTHSGLRAQKPPPPGKRPGRLAEHVPQGFWPGAPRQPGSGAPSLSTPAFADTTADGVDAGALAFLTGCPRGPGGGGEEGAAGAGEGGEDGAACAQAGDGR